MTKKNAKKKKKSIPKLRVAFDTSVLFTDQAHHLLRREAREVIGNNSDHVDLKIEWYLSDVVTGERRYQMQQKASRLYEKVEQLEQLLGHQFTTAEIVADRVRSAIEEQCSALGIEVTSLNEDKVNWANIVERSVNRMPPFDPHVREKGFRDAAIAESFIQLVADSPKTPTSCRLAFISDDALLREYVEERVRDRTNVRILENLNELEGLINTLVSKVPEDKIAEWQEKAKHYFFTKGDESTFFYRDDVRNKLTQEFSDQLNRTPDSSYTRQDATWYIGEPVFIRKDRQRLHWMSEIRAESKLFRETDSIPASSQGLLGRAFKPEGLSGGSYLLPTREEAGTAQSVIEVDWSVSVSAQREMLSQPRIDETRFVDTEWSIEKTTANFLAEMLREHGSKD